MKADASSRLALLGLVFVVILVFVRVLSAGFVEYDDDIHVYANPFMNPVSLGGLGRLWQHAYEGLYNPLAYTIWAGIALLARAPTVTTSSLGQPISLSPEVFHVFSVGLHAANTALCFWLMLRLTGRRAAAALGSLVFAVHPLQVESVSWISELRGLSSACFALGALNVFVASRQDDSRPLAASRASLGASALLVLGATLCKPVAVVLPLVALIIDRVAFGTAWRKALATASVWAVCVLPLAVVTLAVQKIHPEGATLWWQRPFVAGDALAFYLFKTAVPLDLGVEYGRTPQAALSDGWGFVAWALPVGLFGLCFSRRRRHAIAWLGALLFGAFLLPTLGLIPFSFQAHSTVADRYAYLPMLGMGLVVADVVATVPSVLVTRAASAVILLFAVRAFDQTSHWLDNVAFLRHTLEVNPNVAFAQNNLGTILLKEQRIDEAIRHFDKALELGAGHALAQNNLGLALVAEGRLAEAEPHFQKAVELDPAYFRAYENLGAVYLRTNRFDEAIVALKRALELKPSEAKALNDLGIACMRSRRAAEGVDAFQRAVALEPDNASYRKNLEVARSKAGAGDEHER